MFDHVGIALPSIADIPNMSPESINDLSLKLRNKGNDLAELGKYSDALKVMIFAC